MLIEKYVAALDDPSLPPTEFHWAGPNSIQIRTTASPRAGSFGYGFLPSGWHAKVGSRAIDLRRDGLGLILLRPDCSGLCEIQLDYDGGWELRLCRYISFASIGVTSQLCFLRRRPA